MIQYLMRVWSPLHPPSMLALMCQQYGCCPSCVIPLLTGHPVCVADADVEAMPCEMRMDFWTCAYQGKFVKDDPPDLAVVKRSMIGGTSGISVLAILSDEIHHSLKTMGNVESEITHFPTHAFEIIRTAEFLMSEYPRMDYGDALKLGQLVQFLMDLQLVSNVALKIAAYLMPRWHAQCKCLTRDARLHLFPRNR